jgi:hypothetical protein
MLVSILKSVTSHIWAIFSGILVDGKRAQEFCWEGGQAACGGSSAWYVQWQWQVSNKSFIGKEARLPVEGLAPDMFSDSDR